jgi:alkaline phosphatase D
VYIPAFFATYFSEPRLEVVEDKATATVEETVVQPETQRLTQEGVAVEPEPAVVVDEVTVKEEVVLADKDSVPWKILLWGAPNARRFWPSVLTFAINAIFIALTADALYRGRWLYPANDLSFVRLGHVSPTEAKFLIREPDQAKMPVTLEIHIKDAQPPFDNTIWQTVGGVRWTSNETDYTGALTVPLSHSHQRIYEWRTSNNHSGEFLSPPRPGHIPEYNGGKYTFLSTSCILPRFPYNPLDHALAIPGLRHLANKLPELGAQFMLFLGDFIYVDVPERFGKSVDEYRMQYRQVYASPDWAPVAQNLSWIHVLDDHEIANDWSSGSTGVYKTALEPWNIYQADVNPPKAIMASSSYQRRSNATWFDFAQGPASFFMMDTRSYRSSNNVPFEDPDKTMLGKEQLDDFLAWLARPEPRGVNWKFVASSVPFTKNWRVNDKDTWGGFLIERRKILEAMWDAGARGTTVVVLSGDRHEFAATKFPPPPESRWPETAAAYEFSTSPLNQFASPLASYKQKDDEDVMLKYVRLNANPLPRQ